MIEFTVTLTRTFQTDDADPIRSQADYRIVERFVPEHVFDAVNQLEAEGFALTVDQERKP